MSLSVLYGFRELRAVLGTRILHAAAVRCVRGSLSPLDCSMPIVQIASKALHDANDALLGVHCITRITRPHFHCFSDPRFGALSPFTLSKGPLNDHPPHTPFTHFVRSKSSSLAYRLAFVIYPMFISSDAFGTNVLRPDANGFPPVSSKCAVIQALEPGHRRHRPVTRRWCGLHKCHVSQIKKENNNPPSAICYKNRKTSSLNQNL